LSPIQKNKSALEGTLVPGRYGGEKVYNMAFKEMAGRGL
jgi:hypothetical protein